MTEALETNNKSKKKKWILYGVIGALILAGCVALYITSTWCAESGCHNKKIEEFSFCKEHKCLMEACGKANVEKSSYCEEHKCKIETCVKAGDPDYCNNHECSADCSMERVSGKKYCEDHINCFASGCTKAKVGNSNYCKNHKCAVSGCKDEQEYASKHCKTHTCTYDDCTKKATAGDTYDRHCSSHECTASGCDATRDDGSTRCYEHEEDDDDYYSSYSDDDDETCSICGGRYVCVYCGAEGLYCYNASFGTGQRHYCGTCWADIAEDSVYDEENNIYWDFDQYDPETGYDYQLGY